MELNEYEALRTRHDMITGTVVSGLGVLVAVTAQLLPVERSFLSGFLLSLSAVFALVAKPIFRKQENAALERVRAASRTAGAS